MYHRCIQYKKTQPNNHRAHCHQYGIPVPAFQFRNQEHLQQCYQYAIAAHDDAYLIFAEMQAFLHIQRQRAEQLKKTNPSYTDIFNLLKIDEQYDEDYGLIAKVIRIADKRRFKIPLADLMATNKRSKNYKLLDDYSVWDANY